MEDSASCDPSHVSTMLKAEDPTLGERQFANKNLLRNDSFQKGLFFCVYELCGKLPTNDTDKCQPTVLFSLPLRHIQALYFVR